MKRSVTTIVLAVLAVLLVGVGYAAGQDRVMSQKKIGNNMEVVTICSDNKVFLIVKSKEVIDGVRKSSLGLGVGVTQVLEEKNGTLQPKTCE